ncbi:ribonuclease H-like domain-containing protein [Tanacetum coccineum]
MNTGANYHINDHVHSLSDVLNMCIYPSVSVGDGYSIPVTTLAMVLLRCDITGDLYPVTKPSTIPHAFLTNANIVRYMWLFHHKYLANGIFNRYKALLVANGSTHLEGIDVDDTFSLVIKPDTIQTVLSLATSRYWQVYQLDVKISFLYDDLSETIYMHQPSEFRIMHILTMVVYYRGLFKGSSRPLGIGFNDLLDILLMLGFIMCKYAAEILERTHMANCNPSHTAIDTESKLGNNGDPIFDSTLYRSLVGTLQYFTFTRPDISYAVHQVCLYMYDPWEPYFSDLKRILRLGWLPYYLEINFRLLWAEYRSVANVVAETCWLRNILYELHTPLSSATLVYYYNVNAVYLSSNLVQVLHVPSCYRYADIFTKGLPSTLFEEFRTSLSVRFPPTQTTRVESFASWRGITSSCLQPWQFDASLSDTHLNTCIFLLAWMGWNADIEGRGLGELCTYDKMFSFKET